MPWKEVSVMSQRWEFVELAKQSKGKFTELCRRFSISRDIGYKWLRRYRAEGPTGLENRSRRPHQSPGRTSRTMEQRIVSLRDSHPAWGAWKIQARLRALGLERVPAPSTVHQVLRRQGRIDPAASAQHRAWQRFEQAAPNQLWQMDFKGHFGLGNGERCHPLTVLDDHSRYALCLRACRNETGQTVQAILKETFRRYGLPERMLMDNGSPWGDDRDHPYTPLTVWLLRLGIGICHGRPYHPQTQGKEERFHRTLQVEVLQSRSDWDHPSLQIRFDQWRQVYNHQRPHQALGMGVPASRYQISARSFPEVLPQIDYGREAIVRKVQDHGRISFRHRVFRLSKAFRGYSVALRPTLTDGVWEVYFCAHRIAQIDERSAIESESRGNGRPVETVGK
jgi:transposase InsO family protein